MARSAIHPGVHLAEELREIGMSAAALARDIDVPVNRVTGVINGQRGITVIGLVPARNSGSTCNRCMTCGERLRKSAMR
jgi:hypothetical protein